jgi:hypothetical protein
MADPRLIAMEEDQTGRQNTQLLSGIDTDTSMDPGEPTLQPLDDSSFGSVQLMTSNILQGTAIPAKVLNLAPAKSKVQKPEKKSSGTKRKADQISSPESKDSKESKAARPTVKARRVGDRRGRSVKSPLEWNDLLHLKKVCEISPEFYDSFDNIILQHSESTPTKDKWTQLLEFKKNDATKRVRFNLTYNTQTYTQIINYEKSPGFNIPIRVTITPKKIFHPQRFASDPRCSSWIDETDDSNADIYFEICGYELGNDKEHQKIFRLVVRKSKIDPEIAALLPDFAEPEWEGDVDDEFQSELNTVHAGFNRDSVTGTENTKIALVYNSIFAHGASKKISRFVDVSEFKLSVNETIDLRLIFPFVFGLSYYERIINGLKLAKGPIKTPYNGGGQIEQDEKQRAEVIAMIFNESKPEAELTLQQWFDAFEEEREDKANQAILTAEEKELAEMLVGCDELKDFVASKKLNATNILQHPRLDTKMWELSNKDLSARNAFYRKEENFGKEFKSPGVIKKYFQFVALREEMHFSNILFQLAKKYLLKRSLSGTAKNPFENTGLRMRELVAAVFAKSKGNLADLYQLKKLLCYGVRTKDNGSGNFYTKPFNPAKKITPFMRVAHVLMWNSLIWEFDPALQAVFEKAKKEVEALAKEYGKQPTNSHSLRMKKG